MKETCENVIVQKWEYCVLELQFSRWFHHGVSTTVNNDTINSVILFMPSTNSISRRITKVTTVFRIKIWGSLNISNGDRHR
jgi:hypothetical protein